MDRLSRLRSTSPTPGTGQGSTPSRRTSGGRVRNARLAGFARVPLEPGQTSRVEVALEPRVFAGYDVALPGWRWEPGTYTVALVMDGYFPAWRGYIELPSDQGALTRPTA